MTVADPLAAHPDEIQLLAPAREDARLYRVGAVLESLLEAQWGGPLLDRAPALVETLVEAKEAK